ncbi:TPA: hypothetical protein N0F65_009154 [Lagenidium giganteum]|uniref:Uncharacterized protein n=1 Tax=Lagenidium giganteum TaxID=4803 RepID=A0AAV2YTX7_9STRA|nr:TPA: hypothetical protein N0F65_009154 [Lagenidium giganteum]
MENAASRFGQRLAHTEKKYRDQALKKLTLYLTKKTEWTDLEWDKLWKALFYCMWMSDKRPVQEELSSNLAALVHKLPSADAALAFVHSFFRTMHREWHGIDGLRLDKFYSLIRKFVHQSFVLLANNDWEREHVELFVSMLSSEIVSQLPNGLRMHVCDLYLTELYAAAGAKVATRSFLLLLEPFFTLLSSEYDKAVFKRVTEMIFLPMLADYKFGPQPVKEKKKAAHDDDEPAGETDEDDEEVDEVKVFEHVKVEYVQHRIFEIASADDTAERNRSVLYDLYGKFFKMTKIDSLKAAPLADEDEDVKQTNNKEQSKKRKAEQEPEAEAEPAVADETAPAEKKKRKRNKKNKQQQEEAEQMDEEMATPVEEESPKKEASPAKKAAKKDAKVEEETQKQKQSPAKKEKKVEEETAKKAKKAKAEPVVEEPAKKTKKAKAEPVVEEPAKKTKKAKAEPVVEEPAKKTKKAKAEPVVEEPAKKAKKEKVVEANTDEKKAKKADKEEKADKSNIVVKSGLKLQRCVSCGGFGKGFLPKGKDQCAHCQRTGKKAAPSKAKDAKTTKDTAAPAEKKAVKVVTKSGVKFQRCTSCGGFGKGFLAKGKDQCGHCERTSKAAKKSSAATIKAKKRKADDAVANDESPSAKKVTFGKNKALPYQLSIKRLKASAKVDKVSGDAPAKGLLKATSTTTSSPKKVKGSAKKLSGGRKKAADFF